MEERRQYVRIGKFATIGYTINRGFLKSGSRTLNISEGGMCLPTIQRLEPGTVLDMDIKLEEDNKSFRAVSEVVWSKNREGDNRYPFEAGIKFVDIASNDKDGIKNIARLLSGGAGT